MMRTNPTAAALVIGNELLSGKVDDQNTGVLARELFALGIDLRRVVVCADDIETIVADLDALRAGYDYVFTSGGVGPTHDDVTMRAVARAFGCDMHRSPVLEGLLRAYFGERVTDDHLRMADVPELTELVADSAVKWPTVQVGNVFVLPGLPEIFKLKMPTLREHLQGGTPLVSRAVSTRSDEGEVATLLEGLVARFPEISIGSYPQLGNEPVRLIITFDGHDSDRVDAAATALIDLLPVDKIIVTETAAVGAG